MEQYISLIKTVSDLEVAVNDVVTYTVMILNKSIDDIKDILIMDLLPDYCEFISESIKLDNNQAKNANILSGVYLGYLKKQESKTITFDVKIIKKPSNLYFSKSIAEYKICGCDENQSITSCSNTCELFIREPSLLITKSCDKIESLINSNLNYNIDIYNNGELDLLNLFMVESIPSTLEINQGTFTIDGIVVNNVDLRKGILIGDIKKSAHIHIRYSLRVVSSSLKSKLEMSTKIKYKYLASDNTLRSRESESIKSYLNMPLSTFKSISIENKFELESGKFDIFDINDIKAQVKVNSFHIVKTPTSVSNEGQILSGYKLIVQGVIAQSLEYVSDYFNQGLKTSTFESVFSSYIILPHNFPIHSKLKVESFIEDIYYYKIDSRHFFENISLLLSAKISSGSDM
ncbi:MAG: hypothetical protein RR662_07290 [Clostridia bacterium]